MAIYNEPPPFICIVPDKEDMTKVKNNIQPNLKCSYIRFLSFLDFF